ncbi:uncharacterized protein LOC122380630 [Amphibalanus amphitrite]|uniref:uncharacterized protein LOC122380630 n=1 Tax=Amphibalanus amphitrite TaxID=1232801 RepID=UPI001C9225DB|nr:uncharacterized protein LOC122380630 [Amphibalanus amphitrite]
MARLTLSPSIQKMKHHHHVNAEKILKKEGHRYLVKWHGFRVPTWTSGGRVDPDLIRAYIAAQPMESTLQPHPVPGTGSSVSVPGAYVVSAQPMESTLQPHPVPGTGSSSLVPGAYGVSAQPKCWPKHRHGAVEALLPAANPQGITFQNLAPSMFVRV